MRRRRQERRGMRTEMMKKTLMGSRQCRSWKEMPRVVPLPSDLDIALKKIVSKIILVRICFFDVYG